MYQERRLRNLALVFVACVIVLIIAQITNKASALLTFVILQVMTFSTLLYFLKEGDE